MPTTAKPARCADYAPAGHRLLIQVFDADMFAASAYVDRVFPRHRHHVKLVRGVVLPPKRKLTSLWQGERVYVRDGGWMAFVPGRMR